MRRAASGMRTIFFDNTGPLIKYGNGILGMSDLNPDTTICWRVSRWEMVKLGFKAIAVALITA